MADEQLSRDANRVTVLGGITDDSNQFITQLRMDPTTGRLKVAATLSGTVVSSHIQTDTFTTTAGQNTFTASQAAVTATMLLIINYQPLQPADATAIAPNQIQTVDSFAAGLPVQWLYIY